MFNPGDRVKIKDDCWEYHDSLSAGQLYVVESLAFGSDDVWLDGQRAAWPIEWFERDTSGVRRFECTEGTANKFWEIEIVGNTYHTRWGGIDGGTPQTQVKAWRNDFECQDKASSVVKSKMRKGYREVKV